MTIVEAIKATTEEKPYITRDKWQQELNYAPGHRIRLLPTDTMDCVIYVGARDGMCYPRWNPTRSDLLADDWVTTGPSFLPGPATRC